MTKPHFDLLVRGGILVNHCGRVQADIGIVGSKISGIGDLSASSTDRIVEAAGLHVLPGVIDSQVHFREPGLEHKEDLEAGSRGAVKGGVTTVFEMPNTKPETVTAAALEDKVARARDRMFCDFAFYVGGTEDNAQDLAVLERLPGCCGVKVFMGSSTGSLLVPGDDGVEDILRAISRRAAFHSEDEFRLRERRPMAEDGKVETHPIWRDAEAALQSTQRLVGLARKTGKRIHVLHVSTAAEMAYLADFKDFVTVEVTPQHLTLAAPDCYARLGTKAQMNPPIRDNEHRLRLWQGVAEGVVDVLGSDHAPHTEEEKARRYPASPAGMPGVQTLVPVMLDHVNAGRLTLERFVDLTSHGPNRVFGIAGKGRLAVGYDADLTIVDLGAQREITNTWMETKSGWTPFDGYKVTGWPKGTMVRGRMVMWEDEILAPAHGAPVRFHETLSVQS